MDRAYDEVARQYGFQCRGCKDNCCTSLFFHHTFVEKAYLMQTVSALDPSLKGEIMERARVYVRQTFSRKGEPVSQKLLCPLNQDGKCLTYAQRPMICRLHGLPHELNRPGIGCVRGEGCGAGEFPPDGYIPFDRTPFYQQMALAEMAHRRRFNLKGKTRLTIAQMLMET